ncbi:LysR family transcriptional regulator [Streptomyces albofaciens]|uniref:LysR family transcriptional regulator n=1 Tax=Streptomyces albofaciens TaxID=66866 RepID=UPI001AD6F85F|nr:LysR family transcriptional regulator [Streptomyces albofaciens]
MDHAERRAAFPAGNGGPDDMQLGWLQTFIAVYHTGSFTKAARLLGITQPAVTQHIRGLEAELGKPLFDRTPQGAEPTVDGKALAHDIETPITQINAAVGRYLDQTSSNRPVHIGGPAELVTARVLPSISPLIASGIDVRISLGESPELLAALKNGQLDIAISTIQPRCRGVEGLPLTDEEFALVASPRIADSLPAGLAAADFTRALEKVPLIAYADTVPIIRRYWRTVFEIPPPAHPAVVVPDLRAVVAAVVADAGFSVVPTYLCARELTGGQLVTLLDPEVPPINTFYLATRSGSQYDARLSRLYDLLAEEGRQWKMTAQE